MWVDYIIYFLSLKSYTFWKTIPEWNDQSCLPYFMPPFSLFNINIYKIAL